MVEVAAVFYRPTVTTASAVAATTTPRVLNATGVVNPQHPGIEGRHKTGRIRIIEVAARKLRNIFTRCPHNLLKATGMKTAVLCFAILLAAPAAYAGELHPYAYPPLHGHASQNPGSPRHFHPGYGYRIPGFGTAISQPSYRTRLYHNGNRTHYPLTRELRFNTNQYGGPWYYPGWPANTQPYPAYPSAYLFD